MTTFIQVPSFGTSPYFGDPVLDVGDLPASGDLGEIRVVLNDQAIYYWTGAAWDAIDAADIGPGAIDDTDSVNLTVTAGVLTADVNLSAAAPDAGNIAVALSIETDGIQGQVANADIRGLLSAAGAATYDDTTGVISTDTATIRGYFSGTAPVAYDSGTGAFSMAQANGSTDGFLDSGDWTTFNSKEPAITATTAADYYRGDKSFQPLNVAALGIVTDGSAAGAGTVGETMTDTTPANTTTGVAASGDWGDVASVSLTAGVWLLWGTVGFDENGATLNTSLSCGISDSATGVGISEFDTAVLTSISSGAPDNILATPMVGPINITTPTTYYLNTRFYYSAGTPRHRGRLRALRIR